MMWSDRMELVMFVCNYIIHILPYYAAAYMYSPRYIV